MEVKITKENYKGYIDLYKHNEYMDFPGLKIFATFLGTIMAWLVLNTALSFINPIFFYLMLYGGLAICGAAISNIVVNRIKTKKVLKKKYPFIDYNIKQRKLTELLTKNNLLYHNKETNMYAIYISGELRFLEEAKQNKIERKDQVEEMISFYKQQDCLLSEPTEEKQKVKKLGSR